MGCKLFCINKYALMRGVGCLLFASKKEQPQKNQPPQKKQKKQPKKINQRIF
jgi:hypothetical protein